MVTHHSFEYASKEQQKGIEKAPDLAVRLNSTLFFFDRSCLTAAAIQ